MSKKQTQNKDMPTYTGFTLVKKRKGISEFRLNCNNLTVLYKFIPNTGVVTTNIVYKAGARDESVGETGIAHMLEHMLFKPTTHDLKKKKGSASMLFERETGCILNANTWKDRTTYFFSYPTQHLGRALKIESERMSDVVISDKEFLPEQGNVLSEFDMYNGDSHSALNTQMVCAAYLSHPYGHETIGFREDIERYTPEKLSGFYKNYYRPDNATLMVIGDISIEKALFEVKKHFKRHKNKKDKIPRNGTVEPKQEGLRRTSITRQSNTNLVSIGVKHEGFPSKSWFVTSTLFSILAEGQDSVLHKKLVDKGIAISVGGQTEPTYDENLGIITITLAPNQKHDVVEKITLDIIRKLSEKDIKKLLFKVIQKKITAELFAKGSSLSIAMELTEYVASDSWEFYFKTESILKSITTKQLIEQIKKLFDERRMTIGYFIGTK